MKFIPTVQRERATAMRNAPTPAEKLLWKHLRGSGMGGVKFSRQIAIGAFIADFVARSRMLVVELDGAQHGGARDAWRQGLIEARGYQVLRFGNRDVLENIDGVLRTIWAALEQKAALVEVPPLAPPVPVGGPACGAVSPQG